MARELLSPKYGYTKDKLQVLLGGWNIWKEKHLESPKDYPTVPEKLVPEEASPTPPPQQPATPTAVKSVP